MRIKLAHFRYSCSWVTWQYDCCPETATVSYSLFGRNGRPIDWAKPDWRALGLGDYIDVYTLFTCKNRFDGIGLILCCHDQVLLWLEIEPPPVPIVDAIVGKELHLLNRTSHFGS